MDLKIRWPPHYPPKFIKLRAKITFWCDQNHRLLDTWGDEGRVPVLYGVWVTALGLPGLFFFQKLKRQDIGKQKSIKKTVETSSPPPNENLKP